MLHLPAIRGTSSVAKGYTLLACGWFVSLGICMPPVAVMDVVWSAHDSRCFLGSCRLALLLMLGLMFGPWLGPFSLHCWGLSPLLVLCLKDHLCACAGLCRDARGCCC